MSLALGENSAESQKPSVKYFTFETTRPGPIWPALPEASCRSARLMHRSSAVSQSISATDLGRLAHVLTRAAPS